MRRRDFLYGMGGLAGLRAFSSLGTAVPSLGIAGPDHQVLGMYIHQHWPYNHPYAARTWTLDDYRGYAGSLKKIGYNTLVIWPMLEIMPDPLTPSDQANLAKISRVIDMLHNEFGMWALIALCPNIMADNKKAAKAPFSKRHFFYCDRFVNPGDPAALQQMIDWREKLLRPLDKIDGIAIIDSDPGGYPGSANAQFVNLFEGHRKMLDRLRPGIEMYYWMHVGWEAYCRYYQTGVFAWGTPEESVDILTKMKKVNPSPWGITIHTLNPPPNGTDLKLAERFGLAKNSLAFNYGAIEGEPTFPMTNFGGDTAFHAGKFGAPGGVVGNAQTHCVQLPNTFAFARGATGKPLPTQADYLEFAGNLIQGRETPIVQGWQALAEAEPSEMREMAGRLEALAHETLTPGSLQGLLFGSPSRFMTDLAMELRTKGAFDDFVAASESGRNLKQPLTNFVDAADAWQKRTRYECAWRWPKMNESLKKLRSPAVDAVLDEKGEGPTPFARIADHFRITETYTPRLLQAMKEALKNT